MEVVLVALIGSVVGPTVLWFLQRQTRIDEKNERTKVAGLVAEVAVKAEKQDKKLDEIAATGDATHKMVNNQRTVMLRQIAVLARVIAVSKPDDAAAQEAAEAAEKDLVQNEADNAEVAQAKTDRLSADYARAERQRRGDA